jgi:glycosyltransferase involved in cell wall biosynthesis
MKKILVLVSGYPSKNNAYNCTWAHIRNRFYIKAGYNVNVLVMDVDIPYVINEVDVITYAEAKKNTERGEYDLIISHSPNIRKHIPFLWKFTKIPVLLFMHGTESCYAVGDYPKPYPYMESNKFKLIVRNTYDYLKSIVLKYYILSRKESIKLIFVSNIIKSYFEKNIYSLRGNYVNWSVINNSLNPLFLNSTYTPHKVLKADFVTLRSLDHSKFAIDLVVASAKANPSYTFHIYGKGKYFEYNKLPKNVMVFDYHIEQDLIPELLNEYRCALMPTRWDTQGVMVGEMATFGMPVITTNIDVNKEMLSDFENVTMLEEESFSIKNGFDNIKIVSLSKPNKERFSLSNTIDKELIEIKKMCGEI